MRVAFLTHSRSLMGANRSLLGLIQGLKPLGIESFVVAPARGDVVPELERRQIPVAVVAYQWCMASGHSVCGRWKRALINRLRLPSLARQLGEWGVDIVHSNSSVIAIGQEVSEKLGKPHVWHFREFGRLHCGFEPDRGRPGFDQLVARADALIAISEAVRSGVLKGHPPEKMHVVYNGVATEKEFDELYHQARAVRPRVRPYTFLLIGRFNPNKGQDVAIRAFARIADQFPSAHLELTGPAGKAEYMNECHALVRQEGLAERVHFHGYVTNPFDVILRADVVLMCSRHEAMGRVTAEAMAACRPVIGLASGATPELIRHEQSGLLYEAGAEGLARCMARCLQDPDWARSIGERGWKEAKRRFATETQSREVYRVYQSVAAGL